MTKQRKIDLLYAKATGGNYNPTPAEKMELNSYRVDFNEGRSYATKKNITMYVNAMEGKPIKRGFYDWCMDNGLGDRRRKGGTASAMKAKETNIRNGAIFIGWFPWAAALYYILGGAVPVMGCFIAGVIISLILYKISRQHAMLTMFLLPIVISVIFYTMK